MVAFLIIIFIFCAILAVALLVIVFNYGSRLLPTSPRSQPRLNLHSKIVLLTGASSGIGREMAKIMHAKGAKLILAARSTDKLEKLSLELAENEISPKGGPLYKPQYCYLDVEAIVNDKTKLAEFLTVLKHAQQHEGGDQCVDVLVNNAGQMAYGEGAHTDLAVLKRMLDVNYLGQVALTQALWEQIPDDGAIVLLGSIVGRVALPYMGAYSAAKHAVQAFFDSLRCEQRPRLQILTISAGYVNTDLGPNALDERGGRIGRRDPGQVSGMNADEAAAEIVKALEARDTELLLAPFLPRFLLSLRLFVPNVLWFFLHRNLRSLYGNFGKSNGNKMEMDGS